MKKMLLLSPLLILGLGFNGCMKRNINTITQPQSTSIQTTSTQTMTPSTPHIVTTRGNTHQLRTVQGSIITVQERSNGFYFPQYKDKIVLLQLFGKECQYCHEEVPFIKSIQRKYSYQLRLVAIQAQEKMHPQRIQGVLQEFQMNYPVIDKDEANNLLFFIKSNYGWTGILPYILLIKNGVTEYSFSGKVNHQEFEEAIQNII